MFPLHPSFVETMIIFIGISTTIIIIIIIIIIVIVVIQRITLYIRLQKWIVPVLQHVDALLPHGCCIR